VTEGEWRVETHDGPGEVNVMVKQPEFMKGSVRLAIHIYGKGEEPGSRSRDSQPYRYLAVYLTMAEASQVAAALEKASNET
jgi:hypothetical protein